jgi:hypothetical protein
MGSEVSKAAPAPEPAKVAAPQKDNLSVAAAAQKQVTHHTTKVSAKARR